MFELYRYFRHRAGVPRTLTRWPGFENALLELSRVRQGRFLQELTFSAPNIRFWNALLSNSDPESFFTHTSDQDWYADEFLLNELTQRQLYDPVLTHRTFRSLFYSNPARTREYLIDIDYRHPFDTLPFNQPWIEDPQERPLTQAPIQLIYHDSPEFVFHLHRDTIIHKREPPKIAFVGINLDLLMLTWRQYLRAGHAADTREQFFHRYVIFPFHLQLVDLWLFNMISDLIECRYAGRSSMSVLEQYQRVNIPSNLKQGVKELELLLDQVFTYRIRLNDFMHTPIIRKQSLMDRLRVQMFTQEISPLRQYFYLSFLAEYPLLKALIVLLKSQPLVGENDRILKRVKLWLIRIGSTNITRIPGDEESYALIRSKYDHLMSLMK